MDKRALVRVLRERFPHLPAAVIKRMTDAVFETIADTVARDDVVEIRGFGTFFSTRMSRRLLRSPGGGMLEAPSRRLPRFRASRHLRIRVDGVRR